VAVDADEHGEEDAGLGPPDGLVGDALLVGGGGGVAGGAVGVEGGSEAVFDEGKEVVAEVRAEVEDDGAVSGVGGAEFDGHGRPAS
jgi:hypothetical protein